MACPLLCGEPGLCQGITIHRESADTTTECQDACTNFTGCNYYTYDPTIAECFMFDTCPSVDNTLCPDCVSGSPGCGSSTEDGNIHHGTCVCVCVTLKSTKYLLPLGYFFMVICGYGDGAGDNVELVPIDPDLYPVPECLSQLNPSPAPLVAMAGALDYSRKSDKT